MECRMQLACGLWFAGSWKRGSFWLQVHMKLLVHYRKGGDPRCRTSLSVPEVCLRHHPPHAANNPTPTATTAPNRPPFQLKLKSCTAQACPLSHFARAQLPPGNLEFLSFPRLRSSITGGGQCQPRRLRKTLEFFRVSPHFLHSVL
jgi:hypothetical protein